MFGTKFKFGDSYLIWNVSSLNESKLIKISHKDPKNLINHHKKHFSKNLSGGFKSKFFKL